MLPSLSAVFIFRLQGFNKGSLGHSYELSSEAFQIELEEHFKELGQEGKEREPEMKCHPIALNAHKKEYMLAGRAKDVLESTFLLGPLKFMTQNPGRQYLTASFQAVTGVCWLFLWLLYVVGSLCFVCRRAVGS